MICVTLLSLFCGIANVSAWSTSNFYHVKFMNRQQHQFDLRRFVATTERTRRNRLLFMSFSEDEPYLPDDIDPFGAGINFSGDDEEDYNDESRPTDEELEASMTEWDNKIAQFNTVHLVGRIGQDPQPRYFDDGKVVVNVSIASRRKYHALERQSLDIKYGQEETDWYDLTIWGQTAEFVAKYVDKGSRVGVIGTLQIDSWTDKQTGEQRTKPKIIVRDFDILETRAEADARRSNRGRGGGGGGGYYNNNNNNDGSDDYYNPSSGPKGGFFDS